MRPVIVEGHRAETAMAASLGIVTQALPYLSAAIGLPATPAQPGAPAQDGDWLLCEELLGNGPWLETVIRGTGRRLGTGSGAVAASLFVLGYSYRVLTLAVTCLLMGGSAPGSRAEDMAVALSKGRPVLVAYRRPRALLVGGVCEFAATGAGPGAGPQELALAVQFILAEAVEGHLRLLVEATGARVKVGQRLLWGNVAASAAVAFLTVEGRRGEWVKPLAEHFFAQAPQELRGQGSFLSLEHGGRRGWFWERRNCCLNDRLPEHIRCRDCSLTPAAERRAHYLAGLAAPGEGATGSA